MLTASDIATQAHQVMSLEKRVELYARCVHAVSDIIESGGVLNDARLAHKLGYGTAGGHNFNFVWRSHPQLGRIIRDYQFLMSGKKVAEVKQRIALRNTGDRKKSSSLILSIANETRVINAAVALHQQGKIVCTNSLSQTLKVGKKQIWAYLRFQDELKEEIGYVLYAKQY